MFSPLTSRLRPLRRVALPLLPFVQAVAACASCGTVPEPPPPDPVPPREQQLCWHRVDNGGDGDIEFTTRFEYDSLGRLWREWVSAEEPYSFRLGMGSYEDGNILREHFYDESGCEIRAEHTYSHHRQILEYECDSLGRRVTQRVFDERTPEEGTETRWTYDGDTENVVSKRRSEFPSTLGHWVGIDYGWEGDCNVSTHSLWSPPWPIEEEWSNCSCYADRIDCVGTSARRPDIEGWTSEFFDSDGHRTRYAYMNGENHTPSTWWDYEYNDQGNVVRATNENRDGIIGIVMYEYAYLDEGGCPRESTDLEGSGSEP